MDRQDDIEPLVVAEFQDDLNVGNSLAEAIFNGFDGLLKVHRVQFMRGPPAANTEELQGGTILNQNTHARITWKSTVPVKGNLFRAYSHCGQKLLEGCSPQSNRLAAVDPFATRALT